MPSGGSTLGAALMGNQHPGKAQTAQLSQTQGEVVHRADFAGEANLANGSDVVGNGLVPIAGGQGQNQRKICCGSDRLGRR